MYISSPPPVCVCVRAHAFRAYSLNSLSRHNGFLQSLLIYPLYVATLLSPDQH